MPTRWNEIYQVGINAARMRDPTEADVRRGISAIYYGLFHRLIAAGTELFKGGGEALQSQVARAYAHGPMRRVCERYINLPNRPFPKALDSLNQPPPDKRLIVVADAFAKLQEARHAADYDLQATFTFLDARDFLLLAEDAHEALDALQNQPATTVFLTALLLDDRWARRG